MKYAITEKKGLQVKLSTRNPPYYKTSINQKSKIKLSVISMKEIYKTKNHLSRNQNILSTNSKEL